MSSDLRTTRPPYEPHTTQSTETTLPPCRRSTICDPQSRQAGIAALRRALCRLRRLGTYHVPCVLGAGRASALDKRVPSSLDGRELAAAGPGSRSLASSRSRPSTPSDPSRVNVQTLSRRTNTRDPVSHACDGQVGRKLRRPDVRRSTVFQNNQFPSCISRVLPGPIISSDDTSQHRFRSGVRLHLVHREGVVQASPGINLAPDVAPQVRQLMCWPRWPYAHAGLRLAQQSCCP